METQTNNAKSKSLPKWISIVLLIGGIILIIIGLVRIFGSAASKALVNKFNEFQGPTAQTGDDLKNVSDLLIGIAAKEQTKDYTGAVTDLQTALTKLNDAESSIKSLMSLTSEFKGLIDRASDQNIKIAGSRFIDASNSRNTAVLKMVTDTKELINLILPYYDGLINGKKVVLDESKITAVTNQLTANSQSMTKISAELDSATQNLAKAANFKLTDKK